jgi:hypothetical protein
MRWRNASRTASSAAVLVVALAGCGGSGERLPVLTALRLARLADGVAAGRNCGAPLVQATIAAVNHGEIPASLQEQLLSDANRVAATCSRSDARALAARLRS